MLNGIFILGFIIGFCLCLFFVWLGLSYYLKVDKETKSEKKNDWTI